MVFLIHPDVHKAQNYFFKKEHNYALAYVVD